MQQVQPQQSLLQLQTPSQPIDQQTKETTIFALTNDYYKSLLYYVLDSSVDQKLDENFLKDLINSNESLVRCIQNVYVLYGNTHVLIVAKSDTDLNQLNQDLIDFFTNHKQETNIHLLKRKSIPFTSGEQPILLVGELTDYQLKLISQVDKNTALKAIESKTGLKLKKVKKTFYFTGLLFQFVILNEFLNDQSKLTNTNSNQESVKLESPPLIESQENKPKQDQISSPQWLDLYNESSVKGHFMLKPKLIDENQPSDFYYNVYIFEADLTDLNTDCIVNAANANLHPGYDGLARRLREKSGKQMQDACKRIIKQDRNNVDLKDSECVITKAYGKLKSKYVLHSVAPTWSNYLNGLNSSVMSTSCMSNESSPSVSLSSPSSLSSSPSYKQTNIDTSIEKFEYLLNQTFVNIFKLAHDVKFQIDSISLPVMSTSQGGAFDLPLDLCAHTIFTQLIDFKLSSDLNKQMNTICIASLETNTVKVLCDIFKTYTDCYLESSWAIPTSPLTKLTSAALEEKQSQQQLKQNNKDETNTNLNLIILQNNQHSNPKQEPINENKNESISVTIQQQENVSTNTNNSRIVTLNDESNTRNYNSMNSSSLVTTIKPNNQQHQQQHQHIHHPRTLSNSSENNYFKQLDATKSTNRYINNSANLVNYSAECFICQKELKNSNRLLTCGSQNCSSIFCMNCLNNYWMNTKSQKCPACRNNFDKSVLKQHNNNITTSSSIQSVFDRLTFPNQQDNNHSMRNHSYNNAITDAKIYVKILNEPCDGYEKYRTLIVTFEIEDGIQNDNHPRPGEPYKGTLKRAYLPEIKEHREILSFYEKALKSGRLFRIALSRQHEDYRALLNQEVLLKTCPNGGGKYGYPDNNYIRDLLQMAKEFK